MCWLYDGGFQEGDSEGTRSSGMRSCSSGAPVPFEDGEGVVRREELFRREGKGVVVRQVPFHKYI